MRAQSEKAGLAELRMDSSRKATIAKVGTQADNHSKQVLKYDGKIVAPPVRRLRRRLNASRAKQGRTHGGPLKNLESQEARFPGAEARPERIRQRRESAQSAPTWNPPG